MSNVAYSRLVATLRGDVPTIHTVAILSAALDDALEQSEVMKKNVQRNADLLVDLATYSTRQIRGRFGPLENPYVVSNSPRTRLVELGVKYGQDAVIFGYRKGGKTLGLGFEWICTSTRRGTVGNVEATRTLFLEPRQPVGHDEPRGGVNEGDSVSLRAKGAPFVIPFFDEDEDGEADWRGGTVLTYRRDDLPDTPQVQEAMVGVVREEAFLRDAQRRKEPSHCLYTRRGALNNRLRDLHQIMGNWIEYQLQWERTW